MKKTILSIGITILFVGMSFNSISGFQIDNKTINPSNRDNTLYVGGNGSGNYSEIQDAVDDASPGDTVFVYHGIYNKKEEYDYQLVKISKPIKLIGEDKNTTILNGSGKYSVVRIHSGGVELCGFTVRKDGGETYSGAGVHIWTSEMDKLNNIKVYDNILKDNNLGLTIYDCKNSIFHNNIFLNNYVGVKILNSVNCSVFNNYFIENSNAIGLEAQTTITIEHNEFKDGGRGIGLGTCKGVTIQSNNFINNNIHANFIREGQFVNYKNLLKYTQIWKSNYWDNWQIKLSKPIFGMNLLYFPIGGLFWFTIFIPAIEFDKTPAQEPYDI